MQTTDQVPFLEDPKSQFWEYNMSFYMYLYLGRFVMRLSLKTLAPQVYYYSFVGQEQNVIFFSNVCVRKTIFPSESYTIHTC